MKLFDPTSKPVRAQGRGGAPAGDARRAARWGWSTTPSSTPTRCCDKLADRLRRRHGMTVSVTNRKRSPSHEIDEAGIRALRSQADLVVSGIGD